MTRETFASYEYYHIYNRGVDKRVIFTQTEDYQRFISLLYLCNSSNPVHFNSLSKSRGSTSGKILESERINTLVDIGSYCLMPNHFHLLIRAKDEQGISKFMQKLATAYTMYFNLSNERTGALFQGRFKSQRVSNNRYLKYLFSYIHLNPVKLIEPHWKENGVEDLERCNAFLKKYNYSSYLDFIGEARPERKLINLSAFPHYFEAEGLLTAHLEDWLTFRSMQG